MGSNENKINDDDVPLINEINVLLEKSLKIFNERTFYIHILGYIFTYINLFLVLFSFLLLQTNYVSIFLTLSS